MKEPTLRCVQNFQHLLTMHDINILNERKRTKWSRKMTRKRVTTILQMTSEFYKSRCWPV